MILHPLNESEEVVCVCERLAKGSNDALITYFVITIRAGKVRQTRSDYAAREVCATGDVLCCAVCVRSIVEQKLARLKVISGNEDTDGSSPTRKGQ